MKKALSGGAVKRHRLERFCPACHQISFITDVGPVGGHKNHGPLSEAYCPVVDRAPTDEEKRAWHTKQQQIRRQSGGFVAYNVMYADKCRRDQSLVMPL